MSFSHRFAAALMCVSTGLTVAPALAQTLDSVAPLPLMPSGTPYVLKDITPGLSGTGHDHTYGSRVVQPVYQTNDTSPAAVGSGGLYLMEDVSFNPGPWAAPQTRTISTFAWYFQAPTWAGTGTHPTATFDIVLEFWNAGDYTANPMEPAGSAPFDVRLVQAQVPSGYAYWAPITFSTPVTVPADHLWIGIRYIQSGSYGTTGPGTRLYDATPGSANPAGQSATTQLINPRFDALTCSVGSTTNDFAVDKNNDGIFQGGAAGSTDHVTSTHHQSMEIDGDAIATAPTPNFTICGPDLADGLTIRNDNISAGQVRWYQVCVGADVSDALLHFLDIDTETSATQVAIGLFAPDGTRMASDDGANGSTGGHSQLSFGVGRRPQYVSGQGKQYDGRNGQLLAATGATGGYYLAVAPQGTTFGSGFTVTTGAGAGGAYTLRFNTNVNGAPLAASVPPVVDLDYGTLNFPGAFQGTAISPTIDSSTGFGSVIWTKFTLAHAAQGTTFFDADLFRLSDIDTVAYIFDANGNFLYFDDSDGPTPPDEAQFSLGAAHNATYGLNTVPFTGATPAGNTGLPAGTYYMAIAIYPTEDLGTTAPAGGRFHVRALSGSDIPVGADLYTGGAICGSSDFNGDGDFGTDADIEAFFACLAGNCCATCGSADFNGDGDYGTDADIEAFFRVLAGGTC
jgi:hypothetical protein